MKEVDAQNKGIMGSAFSMEPGSIFMALKGFGHIKETRKWTRIWKANHLSRESREIIAWKILL